MRMLIIGFVVFLYACNGSGNSAPSITQADIKAAIAPLQAKVNALQASNDALKDGQAKLTLIGKLHGVSTDAVGRTVDAVGNPVSFGPCADMGVLEGTTFASGNGPLGATYQAFKNCTNTHAEYAVDTGALKVANRLYYTTLDCSGIAYTWQGGGQGYNSQALNDGVVFISPASGEDLWVTPGQIPVMTQVASIWVLSNGDCEADGDLQPMWSTVSNDTSKTGVPTSVGKYQLASP